MARCDNGDDDGKEVEGRSTPDDGDDRRLMTITVRVGRGHCDIDEGGSVMGQVGVTTTTTNLELMTSRGAERTRCDRGQRGHDTVGQWGYSVGQ